MGQSISQNIAHGKVILGGDFNKILDINENMGGTRWIGQSQKEFYNFVKTNNLIDIKATKKIYTWNNRRKDFTNIEERLDRFLISEDRLQEEILPKAFIRPATIFDHFPVELFIIKKSKLTKGHLDLRRCGTDMKT